MCILPSYFVVKINLLSKFGCKSLWTYSFSLKHSFQWLHLNLSWPPSGPPIFWVRESLLTIAYMKDVVWKLIEWKYCFALFPKCLTDYATQCNTIKIEMDTMQLMNNQSTTKNKLHKMTFLLKFVIIILMESVLRNGIDNKSTDT